jgi:hypothetical protein
MTTLAIFDIQATEIRGVPSTSYTHDTPDSKSAIYLWGVQYQLKCGAGILYTLGLWTRPTGYCLLCLALRTRLGSLNRAGMAQRKRSQLQGPLWVGLPSANNNGLVR